jgi:hypothetical protein
VSNAPEGPVWWSDHPQAWTAGPPPGAWGVQRVAPPSVGWRIARSLWLLFPLCGCGCLGGLALVFVGAYVRKVSWWMSGIGYFLVSGVAFAVTGAVSEKSVAVDISVGVLLLVWLACLTQCCVVNVWWLRILRAGGQWYQPAARAWPEASPGARPATWASPERQPGVPPVARPEMWASPEMGSVEPPVAAPASPAATEIGGPTSTTPIDINTATAAEFAELEGFDPVRGAQVEQTRQMLGGFVSTAQFAAAAGLAPHEYARIRTRITCGPLPSVPPAGEDQQVPPHRGRILDV